MLLFELHMSTTPLTIALRRQNFSLKLRLANQRLPGGLNLSVRKAQSQYLLSMLYLNCLHGI